ncbi:MAG: hypothetical protein ACI383_02190 [Rummeliibacillus sp.]
MKNITREINESFIFPESYGCPVKVREIKVVPHWEQQVDDLSLTISGIYHLSAFLEFDKEKERVKQLSNECTLIDDVEWKEKEAYFEYANPFEISLPKEIPQSSVKLNARDIKVEMQDDGICQVKYQVECSYEELQNESSEAVVQPVESTDLVDLSDTSTEAYDDEESIISELLWDLEEHYTTVEIQLNGIRK